MDQYTNYFDALSQSMYSQQANAFLSPESPPPSLSSSPVSSEASDSLLDEAIRYGLYGYDPSPAVSYNPYNQNSINVCDTHFAFDRDTPPSFAAYQPLTGYATQEPNPLAFDYAVHLNTVTSLTNVLANSVPFATVAPSVTSALIGEDTSACNLAANIAELSISTPASSPMYRATSLGSSPSLVPVLHPQPTLVCDPKTLNSPVTMEQAAIQAGPSSQVKGTRRTKTSSSRVPAADSDYSPSGESEVEDENDRSYGEPPNRKKTRSARVSHAAHPYLKPASKPKSNKGRGAKLEVPVPVPGLTKNSRGRCVPKKTEGDFEDRSRPFWCRVKDCNKLFGRGEHLKRHIKSIHTEEKPFQCECQNPFTRQDNLFQHMRAKGCVNYYHDGILQRREKKSAKKTKTREEEEDLYIERIMADAKIAQDKRDRACKQMRLRF